MSQTKAQLIEGSAASELTAAKTLLGVGSASAPSLTVSGDTNTGIYFPTADTIGFTEGGVEAARIDSSGRLLVGTSTARSNFFNTTQAVQVQLEGTNSTTSSAALISNNSGSAFNQAILVLARSKGSAIGSNTLVASGDYAGSVAFQASDGSEFVTLADISAVVDGTPGANDMPGRLVFSTTADGAASPTERMRITNGGNIDFGSFSLTGVTQGRSHTDNGRTARSSVTGTGFTEHNVFYNPNGAVGSISTSGSATAYNTSSDYRLKENVVSLTGAIDRVIDLQVHRFNFIADPDTVVDGFIAHEAQTVVPECVTGTKDEVDADGNPVYQGIDQSKLVPLLTAALQEALQKIEDLEGRLTAAGL
jgi:hypothetical protein